MNQEVNVIRELKQVNSPNLSGGAQVKHYVNSETMICRNPCANQLPIEDLSPLIIVKLQLIFNTVSDNNDSVTRCNTDGRTLLTEVMGLKYGFGLSPRFQPGKIINASYP